MSLTLPRAASRFAWLRSGLLWRTFFLLAFLITASMATWVASFRMVERTPRANQIAAQVVSIVTLTRAALTHSAPDLRRELLFDLASNEGIRIYAREATDVIRPPADNGLMTVIEHDVRARLGASTVFAGSVNNLPGFWVSFRIDEDEYWLALERERVDRASGGQWLGWVAVTMLLSLLGAVFISRLINEPLARLTAATRSMAKGQPPEPLPEAGPTEIRQANLSFNQMVDDLQRVESDRAVILAGISHDLRTPISRMMLEVEMAKLPDDARRGMQSDLAQMDAIIAQFLDYARPIDSATFSTLDLSALLAESVQAAQRSPDLKVTARIQPRVQVRGNPTDLRRVINNLLENARRYGHKPGIKFSEVDVNCRIEGQEAVVEIRDRGPGVPEAEIDHLLRPFTRMNSARSQANGAGLGLAIVDRVLQNHGATLRLHNREGGGGLVVQFRMRVA
ncbi:sensor histidine kinase [Lacisediminimonas sp.]|uniref:sensor histidine kinase n=1 Tax=Lacisediminimonas sp. TaxID=3060582 RepID=UPI00272663F0|nr:sensor histidine kinase [Lacisediminimonas sp.]MDO8299905.1 ATP-binding protein [Lacisediminimonas sp.]